MWNVFGWFVLQFNLNVWHDVRQETISLGHPACQVALVPASGPCNSTLHGWRVSLHSPNYSGILTSFRAATGLSNIAFSYALGMLSCSLLLQANWSCAQNPGCCTGSMTSISPQFSARNTLPSLAQSWHGRYIMGEFQKLMWLELSKGFLQIEEVSL